jgi:enamine deaminase RidA (YjgF/YER057c/UK114 family)
MNLWNCRFAAKTTKSFCVCQPFPARTTIGVAALPLGARVEIDLVVKA